MNWAPRSRYERDSGEWRVFLFVWEELGEATGPAGAARPAGRGSGGGHPDDRLVQAEVARGTLERRVAEAEDAAVSGHEPVPVAGGTRSHADDRLVETEVPGRSIE